MFENNLQWSTPVIEEIPLASLLDLETAEKFLRWLRPDGPWVLSYIVVQDGAVPITCTFTTIEPALAWVREHNVARHSNIYFTVNRVRGTIAKKPAKTDIAVVEFVHGDLDPKDDETPEAAKTRYLAAIRAPETGIPASTLIDSGNGIQTLTRLAEPVVLGELVIMPDGRPMFSPDDTMKIAEVEGRSFAVMLAVGAKPDGTQNIDRILRLPGTINYPTAVKVAKGRTIEPTGLIETTDAVSALADFPSPPMDFPPTRPSPWACGPVPPWLEVAINASTGRGVSTAPGDLIDGGLAGIMAALYAINPDVGRPEWIAVGCVLYKLLGEERGFELWDDWSHKGQKYRSREMSGQWRSIANGGGYGWGIGTLLFYANEAKKNWRDTIPDWQDKLLSQEKGSPEPGDLNDQAPEEMPFLYGRMEQKFDEPEAELELDKGDHPDPIGPQEAMPQASILMLTAEQKCDPNFTLTPEQKAAVIDQLKRGRELCGPQWEPIPFPEPDGPIPVSRFLYYDRAEQTYDKEEPEPEPEPGPPPPPPPPEPKPKCGWIKTSAAFIDDFKQPDYLIYGLLLRAFIYSMTGMTGAGKTSVCLRVAAHVALGLPIGKLEVARGKVLYFAGENADDVRMRWIKLCEDLKVNPADIDVYFVDFRMQMSLDTVKLRLGNESVDHGPFALVIVDTSIAYFEGDNENDNVQAAAHAKMLRGLIDVVVGRPTVIVTAHPVKNATTDNLIPRGGGAFLNEMDGNLVCKKNDANNVSDMHWQGKFRGPDFAPISFKLTAATTDKLKDTKGRPIWTVTAAPIDAAEKAVMDEATDIKADNMLVLLSKHTDLSQLQMAQKLGWAYRNGEPNKSLVERTLKRLVAEKQVERQGRYWLLTKKGQAAAKRVAEAGAV
jgi:hypothetical protein